MSIIRRIKLTDEERRLLTADVPRGALSKLAHQPEQPRLGNALPCPRCHATGQISLMWLPGKRTCPACNGAGWKLADSDVDADGSR